MDYLDDFILTTNSIDDIPTNFDEITFRLFYRLYNKLLHTDFKHKNLKKIRRNLETLKSLYDNNTDTFATTQLFPIPITNLILCDDKKSVLFMLRIHYEEFFNEERCHLLLNNNNTLFSSHSIASLISTSSLIPSNELGKKQNETIYEYGINQINKKYLQSDSGNEDNNLTTNIYQTTDTTKSCNLNNNCEVNKTNKLFCDNSSDDNTGSGKTKFQQYLMECLKCTIRNRKHKIFNAILQHYSKNISYKMFGQLLWYVRIQFVNILFDKYKNISIQDTNALNHQTNDIALDNFTGLHINETVINKDLHANYIVDEYQDEKYVLLNSCYQRKMARDHSKQQSKWSQGKRQECQPHEEDFNNHEQVGNKPTKRLNFLHVSEKNTNHGQHNKGMMKCIRKRYIKEIDLNSNNKLYLILNCLQSYFLIFTFNDHTTFLLQK